MKEVLAKLQKIQTELKVPKSHSTTRYKYRNCEDILEAVKPIAAKHNCVVTLSDEINIYGDRFYVTASATLYDSESDDYITAKASAREESEKKGMDGSQITGSASSYARKYALNGLFGIDDTKDSDTPQDSRAYTCRGCGAEMTFNGMEKDGTYYTAEQWAKAQAMKSHDKQLRCDACTETANKEANNE